MYSERQMCFQQIVTPECFNPVPAVTSAVLEITPKSISPNIKLDIALEKIKLKWHLINVEKRF